MFFFVLFFLKRNRASDSMIKEYVKDSVAPPVGEKKNETQFCSVCVKSDGKICHI